MAFAAQVVAIHEVSFVEPFTTLVLQSGYNGETRGFCYAVGGNVPGCSAGLNATPADTNLNVPNMWNAYANFLGLEWSIPRVTQHRYLPSSCQGMGDYPVTPADISEFVMKCQIRLYVDGDGAKPFVSYVPFTADVRQDQFRATQRIVFAEPLRWKEGYTKLWLETRWPTAPPQFGVHPGDSTAQARGSLVIVFKLLTSIPQDVVVQKMATTVPFETPSSAGPSAPSVPSAEKSSGTEGASGSEDSVAQSFEPDDPTSLDDIDVDRFKDLPTKEPEGFWKKKLAWLRRK